MVFGYGFYVVLLDPLFRRSPAELTVGTVLVTVGALLILSDLAALLAGTSIRGIQVDGPIFVIGDVILSATNLAVMVGIALLVTSSTTSSAIPGSACDPRRNAG